VYFVQNHILNNNIIINIKSIIIIYLIISIIDGIKDTKVFLILENRFNIKITLTRKVL